MYVYTCTRTANRNILHMICMCMCVGSSSVGIVLDGASDDDVKELDEFLENNGHFKVSKHWRTHSEAEERTWGSTVAKVRFTSCWKSLY